MCSGRCWLIERDTSNGIRWYSLEGIFEADTNLAIRFCRKEDAEAIAEMLNMKGFTTVTEHFFMPEQT